MASKYISFLLVLCVLLCGCTQDDGAKVPVSCPDGSFTENLSLCEPTTTVKDYPARVKVCERLSAGEERDLCYASVAIDFGKVELCRLLEDADWATVCYTKLNATHMIPSIPTTSTASTSTTSQSTTTTTTLMCGNGRIDAGEECDTGTLCEGSDGVCALRDGGRMAVCLLDNRCDWQLQTSTSGRRFAMGPCNGCYGPHHQKPCRCIEETGPSNATTATTPEAGHYSCSDGKCQLTAGAQADECTMNRECFHFECKGGECVVEKTPGNSTCENNQDCISIWGDRET